MLQLKEEGGAALVLDDALGIAQSLNTWRNSSLDPLHGWLAEEDKNGVNNDWKLQIQQQISQLHQGYAGEKADAYMTLDRSVEKDRRYYEEQGASYDEARRREIYGENYDAFWGADTAAQQQAERQRMSRERLKYSRQRQYSAQQQAAYRHEFERKYLSRLNMAAMKQVKSAFHQHTREAEQEMDRRAEDQIAVLQSEKLQQALHAYDKSNLQSGARFTSTLGKAVDGLIGCKTGRELMDSWWAAGPQGNPENLCWRAVAYNQKALEENLTELVSVLHEQDNGDNDWSAIGAMQLVQAATSHFEKLDGAIGSLEGQGIAVSGALAWQAGLLRHLFGSGHPTKGDTAMYRLLSTVSRAQLGSYAFDARMNDLLSSGSNANPNRVRGQLNRYSGKSLSDFITQPKTSEIRYGRALSILIALEVVMLLVKAESTQDKGSRFYLQTMAGALAGAACGAELLASAAESAAKRAGPATAEGARILQGNRKLWAASLGTIGGVVLAVYDFADGKDSLARRGAFSPLTCAYFTRALAGGGSLFQVT